MLERGLRQAPRSRTIELLARALNLEPAQHDALVASARDRQPAMDPDSGGDAQPREPDSAATRASSWLARGTPTVRLWSGLVLLAIIAGLGLQVAVPGGRAGIAVTAVGTLAAACSALATAWRKRDMAEAMGDQLDRAADDLAVRVALQWREAANERRLLNPAPIPVRWRLSDHPAAGPIADAVGECAELPRFSPLPGFPVVTAVNARSGDLKDLLAVYGGLDSGRMLVLGKPGAGKTGAAIRLLLAVLEHRRSLARSERSGVPVPVLLSLHGWDPTSQPLTTWLAFRLSRDYPSLRAAGRGRDLATRLVEAGRLAVILDGLDEVPGGLRSITLRALDEQATFRLVLLSRPRELVATATDAQLSGAAVLELQPVDAADAADYLDRCNPRPASNAWRQLLADIRGNRESPVARALDTPLVLTLVRDIYGPGDPVDHLLDRERFGCPEAVADHLLDRVVPAAYAARPGQPPPVYTAAQAQRWLGFIAYRMSQEPTAGDLAWWLLPRWLPAWPRNLGTVLTVVLVGGAAGGLAGGRTGAVAVAGLAGLAAALASLRGTGPPRHVGRPTWKRMFSRANLAFGLAVGVATGLAFGVAVGLAIGLALGLLVGLLAGMTVGLAVGLLFALVDGLAHVTTDPVSPIDPITSWRRDRRYLVTLVVVFIVVGGVTGGLAWALTGWLAFNVVSGLGAGLLGGLAVGLIIGLSGAFRGKLASALVGRMASGFAGTIAFGLILGVAAGSAAALVTGLADGLMFGCAFGLCFGLAIAFADSAAWTAALAFAQLRWQGRAPIRLLRFLEDARHRQVLRVAGPVYQFRHARLRERLAQAFEGEETTAKLVGQGEHFGG